jgi:hypothetical protein
MKVSADGLSQRVAQEWFVNARRWYVEEHQGCPRCQGRHCVFRALWGSRVEYHCTACDFSAAHDEATGIFAANDGEATPPGVELVVDLTRTPSAPV